MLEREHYLAFRRLFLHIYRFGIDGRLVLVQRKHEILYSAAVAVRLRLI